MIWFLHGNLGTPADWEAVRRLLPGDTGQACPLFRLLEQAPLSLPEAGERLAGHILSHDPAPLLCGYSLGGRLALHAYLSRPAAWKGLILLGAHPGLEDRHDAAARRESDERWAARLKNLPWEEFYRTWTAQPVFRGDSPTPRPEPDPAEKEAMIRAFRCWSLGTQENLLPRLKQAFAREHTPCLLLTGELDAKFTALSARLARELPGAQHVVLPGAGHRLPLQCPGAVARLLGDFLSRLPPPLP